MLKRILHELKHHIPFTLLGTLTGVAIMLVIIYSRVSRETSQTLFEVFHPIHVLLSAMVTAGMYRLHGRGRWWVMILIGYFGAIGIATLSDCIIPYIGEILLDLPYRSPHLGFIRMWWLVNPLAFAGIAIAYFWPKTTFPHAGHALLSTWASLFHMLMAMGQDSPGVWEMTLVAVFLFLAVWIPCCTSDIIFPLLFVKKEDIPPCQFCEKTAKKEKT